MKKIVDMNFKPTGRNLRIKFDVLSGSRAESIELSFTETELSDFVYRLLAKKSEVVIMKTQSHVNKAYVSAEFTEEDNKPKLTIYIVRNGIKEYIFTNPMKVLFVNKITNMHKGSYYKAKEEVLKNKQQ